MDRSSCFEHPAALNAVAAFRAMAARLAGIIGCLGALSLGLPLFVCAQATGPERHITVSGSAEIRVVPDTADLTLGIETAGPDLLAARELNARQTAAVLAALKDFGIPDHQVQTALLRIDPRYEPQQQTLIGYRLQRAIAVNYQDLGRFEEFLTAVLQAGAVRVDHLHFGHSQMDPLRDQVRLAALGNARSKAEALAAEFDQMLGPPLEIVEGARPRPGDLLVSGRGVAEAAVRETLAPGQIAVGATLTVTFALRDFE